MTRPFPTSFQDAALVLRQQLREAILDHAAFELPLRLCELNQCRATCCHDGAVLSEDEAKIIAEEVAAHPQSFPPIKDSRPFLTNREGSLKTNTRPATSAELARDFPSHFSPTRCLFLDDEHKCTLQRHSLSCGQHPWYYKPLACWMHPILLRAPSSSQDRPCLTLLRPEEDEVRFASCTPCGRLDERGQPASVTLEAELNALSLIADRNFLSELNAPTI